MSDEPNAGGPYQFAEPQGGCIVPRMGDPERTAAILGQAASWYRGQLSGELLATMRAMSDQADHPKGD